MAMAHAGGMVAEAFCGISSIELQGSAAHGISPHPCENGPRHGCPYTHGERFRSGRTIGRTRGMSGAFCLRLVLGALALVGATGLSGCSSEPDSGDRSGQKDAFARSPIGSHLYTCSDGSNVEVDFLEDGLTIDLRTPPNAAPERLTAPASGVPFVGENVNIALSDGARMTVIRTDEKAVTCRRANRTGNQHPHASPDPRPSGGEKATNPFQKG